MGNLDKILYVVAPVFGVIGTHAWREYDSDDQDSVASADQLLKTADELMNDFSNNENDASVRYNNKVIRVGGTIKSIQQHNNVQTILLSTTSALCSVICHFDEKHKEQLNQLRPWQFAVVKGVCAGILKHVVLEKCELETYQGHYA